MRVSSIAWLWLTLTALCSASCDDTKQAMFVEPAYGDACSFSTCGSHGQCSAASAGGPTCLCEVGYTGPTCSTCEAGFHRDSLDRCVSDTRCADQKEDPCGAYGQCADDQGVIKCSCDAGYEGPRCTLCADRYGRDGLGRCLPLFLTPGSDAGVGGNGSMTCDPGYAGAQCSLCASGYHRFGGGCVADETCHAQSCAQHGTCSADNGSVFCSCENGYAGSNCGRCAPGYHAEGNACVADPTCQLNSCSQNAICSVSSGQITCTCAVGYAGANCNTCASGYHLRAARCVQDQVCQDASCGARAGCEVSNGEAVCICHEGYSGESCEMCAAGYHSGAAGACIKDQQCGPSSCPTHASCRVTGGVTACDCQAGYLGPACDVCAFGYHKLQDGSCVPDEVCSDKSCPAHAFCIMAGGVVQCPCRTDWAGPQCDRCTNLSPESWDFESGDGWTAIDDTCSTRSSLQRGSLTLESRSGEGNVFLCAPSHYNGLTTRHIELESVITQPARLSFSQPVAVVAFDYATRLSALELEIMADDVVVKNISLPRKSKGSVSLEFQHGVRTITLRSPSLYTQFVGIDNLVYQVEQCKQ